MVRTEQTGYCRKIYNADELENKFKLHIEYLSTAGKIKHKK